MKSWIGLGIALLVTGLAGCLKNEDGDENGGKCACTAEYRYNICVIYNGSDSLPDSLTFLRQRQNGDVDSLEWTFNCFGELTTAQRILVQLDSSAGQPSIFVDSSDWFTPKTVDCCHGEAKTIDLGR